MDKEKILDYVMHTPHNTNRAVLNSMLNQLIEGGGSGSSDLSTAKVTLINNTSEPDVTFSIPLVYGGVEGEYPSASTSSAIVEQNLVIDAVLYHGLCNAHISGNFVLTGIGSVTIDGLYADITGDCTITASDPT